MILCRKNKYDSESHSLENTFFSFGFWHSSIAIAVEDDNVLLLNHVLQMAYIKTSKFYDTRIILNIFTGKRTQK